MATTLYALATTDLLNLAKAGSGASQPICSKTADTPIDQLLQCKPISPITLVDYFAALMLLRLEQEQINSATKLSYFKDARSLIERLNNAENKLVAAEACDSIILNEINLLTDVDLVIQWYQQGTEIKNIMKKNNKEIDMAGLNKGYAQFNDSMWQMASELATQPDGPKFLWSLEQLIRAKNLEIDISALALYYADLAVEFLKEKNDLYGILNDISRRNIQEAHSIIQLLKLINTNDIMAKEIADVSDMCTRIEPERANSNQPVRIEGGSGEEEINARIGQLGIEENVPESQIWANQINTIDSSSYVKVNPPLYSNQGSNFQVCIYRAVNREKEVAIKMYKPLNQYANLDRIYKEIQIYEELSKLSGPNNCFLRYFGTFAEGNEINLVMEYHENNLMKCITNLKNQRYNFDEQFVSSTFMKLISSFAQMRAAGIHHGDIKPHNFLVDSAWNIKIIDFSVSLMKNEVMTNSATGVFPIQGTDGYMAPELQEAVLRNQTNVTLNYEKADVFSLGLVLLQVITMIPLTNMNTYAKNQELIYIIDNYVPWDWTKYVLKAMLEADFRKRKLFKDLLSIFPQDAVLATKTRHSS